MYGDCVELPSKDPRHLKDGAILHSLLMQQLQSLITRQGSRANTAGAVPLAVRPPPVQEAPLSNLPDTHENEPQEEEQGGTCTIA